MLDDDSSLPSEVVEDAPLDVTLVELPGTVAGPGVLEVVVVSSSRETQVPDNDGGAKSP